MLKKKIAICVMSIFLGAGTVGIATIGLLSACGDKPQLDENWDFRTVNYALPEDGSRPTDHTGVENIGYMVHRLYAEPNYYSEMHGTVSTLLTQSVDTYKQYSDGVLISTDISESDMVKTARQRCFVGDYVLWRGPASNRSEDWDGVNTVWSEEEPSKIGVKDYTMTYGLPGTDFSVYILNEDTVLNCEDVVVNADGTYSQTYHLDPATDKAAYYYRQQMRETGGLDEWPEFEYITVTYTFDSGWRVLSSVIEEKYQAKMFIKVTCSAHYETVYEYNTKIAQSTAYKEYYSNYADKDVSVVQEKPTVVNCLTQAFGPAIEGEATYALDLALGGETYEALASVNVGNMDIAGNLGAISFRYFDGAVYLDLGGVRLKASVDELLSMLGGASQSAEDGLADIGSGLGGFDLNQLMASLGNGEFTVTEGKATLDAELELVGLKIPVFFEFLLDGNNKSSLGYVSASIALGEQTLSLRLSQSSQTVTPLSVTDRFIDVATYAQQLVDLLGEGQIALDAEYAADGWSLAVDGALDLKGKRASAVVKATVGTAEKTLLLGYAGGQVYLDLDGIKVSVVASQAVGLLSGYLGAGSSAQADGRMSSVLSALLSGEFSDYLTVAEEGNALKLAVKGTELLKAFGVDFALGDVSASFQGGKLTASALGVDLTLAAGEPFTVSENGYIPVTKYVTDLADLLTGDALFVELDYSGYGLDIGGGIAVDVADKKVKAQLDVGYTDGESGERAEKTLFIGAADGKLYLAVDGLKLCGDADGIGAMLAGALGFGGEQEENDLLVAIEKILSIDFCEILALGEEEGVLSLAVKGTELLQAFGVDFALGEVTISVETGKLTASALGANIALTAGEPFEWDAEGYVDATPAVLRILEAVSSKQLRLKGIVELGDATAVEIGEGYLSWKGETLEFYLKASLQLSGKRQPFTLALSDGRLSLVVGELGYTLGRDDLPALEGAIVKLYGTLKDVVDEVAAKELLPEISSLNELAELICSALGSAEMGGSFSAAGMLGRLSFGPSSMQNGIARITLGGLSLDLAAESEPNGTLTAALVYGTLKGEVSLGWFGGEIPALPEVPYLGIGELTGALDYVGAAVGMITEPSLSFNLTGQTVSVGEEYAAASGVKYDIRGTFDYYSGGSFPVHIDVENRNFWLNTSMYAYIALSVSPALDRDDSFFFELYLLDANADGSQDGELDVYLNVSVFGEKDERSCPLKLYTPVSEITGLLATAAALTGLDAALLNEWLLLPVLGAETAARLSAVGDSLKASLGIGDLIDSIFASIGDLSPLEAFKGLFGSVMPDEQGGSLDFLKSLRFTDEEGESFAEVTLSAKTIYGGEMPEDVVVKIGMKQIEKETVDEEGNVAVYTKPIISSASISGVYTDQTAAECTSAQLEIATAFEQKTPSIEGYYNATGMVELIKVLAKSVTTEAPQDEAVTAEQEAHEYRLVKNFYIDGKATLNVIITNVEIQLVVVSVTVDEDGKIGVSMRLQYEGVQELNQVAINGDSVTDITIKDGNVYIKRTQTSEWVTTVFWTSEKQLETPIVIYRAMSMQAFMDDIVDQMAFIFNLGKVITDQLPNGEDGGETTEEKKDVGAAAAEYLKSFAYQAGEGEKSWTLVLNGDSLTDGVLSDITVTLGCDGTDLLRTLNVSTKLVGMLSLSAELHYRNPQGVLEEGVTDYTESINASLQPLEEGMRDVLAQTDWTQTAYLEVYAAQLSFRVEGETVGERTVFYDQSTGSILSRYTLPDYGAYEKAGHTIVGWEIPQTIGGDTAVDLKYEVNVYTVRVESDRSLEAFGFTLGEKSGLWEIEYVYGTKLALPVGETRDGDWKIDAFLNGEEEIGEIENILDDVTLTAVWERIVYTVTYEADGQVFEEQEKYYGDEYTLPESRPEKAGYSFVGWDVPDGTVKGDVTVKAVFEANEYTVTVVSEFSIEAFGFTGGESGYTIVYRYDTVLFLPVGKGSGERYLKAFVDADGTSYDRIENILSDITLSAVWAKSDQVVYTSTVTFTYNGTTYGSEGLTQTYGGEYTLITPEAEGYLFFGWFEKTEEGYRQVTCLQGSEQGITTVAEAVWVSDITVSLTASKKTSGLFSKTYSYVGAVTLNGGALVGNPITNGLQIGCSTSFGYAVDDSDGDPADFLKTEEENEFISSREFSGLQTSDKKTAYSKVHVVVTVTYTYGETTVALKSHACYGV